MTKHHWRCCVLLMLLALTSQAAAVLLATTSTMGSVQQSFESAVGDSGMKDPRVRVALEAWNFCNLVGEEGPGLPSPRQADCADMRCLSGSDCSAFQHVTPQDNSLKAGEAFPQGSFTDFEDPDQYAVQKELYLASLCEVKSEPSSDPWNFWMIMLKNGNFDLASGLCKSTAQQSKLSRPFKKIVKAKGSFPCFGKGCMNQPLIYHNCSKPQISCQEGHSCALASDPRGLSGSFYGTYDLDGGLEAAGSGNTSYFSVMWEKDPKTGSWLFHHILKISRKYPWLMLYLRADTTKGVSGGYPFETRGMMVKVPESPNFKVILTLNVTKGGGPASQFYLLDIGGCWKNDGKPCDGNTSSDVTRYSEMIINPSTQNWCKPTDISQCPPYHTDSTTGELIHRTDTARFPYSAYHLYCAPPNARFAEQPVHFCDPYSNPQPQELMQLLPHPEWAVHGYPAKKGEGWIGDARTWELDVGALSSRLYFYQDPKTPPATRGWPSIDVGTEIYISGEDEVAEWTVSDFDVLIPKHDAT